MVAYGAGMVANFLGGILSDRLSPRPVFMGSLLMATVAAVGWVLIPGTGWPFWVVIAAWGFAVNGAGAVILIYGQDIFPGRAGICLGPSRKLQYSYRGHNRLRWRRRHGGSVCLRRRRARCGQAAASTWARSCTWRPVRARAEGNQPVPT